MSQHLTQAEALNKPATHPAAGTIQCLIQYLKEQDKRIDAIEKLVEYLMEKVPEKEYGLWQVCPKCEGEGKVPGNYPTASTNYELNRTCPLCEGEGKLVRPEIKNDNP